jgi:hypothetical protein
LDRGNSRWTSVPHIVYNGSTEPRHRRRLLPYLPRTPAAVGGTDIVATDLYSFQHSEGLARCRD